MGHGPDFCGRFISRERARGLTLVLAEDATQYLPIRHTQCYAEPEKMPLKNSCRARSRMPSAEMKRPQNSTLEHS